MAGRDGGAAVAGGRPGRGGVPSPWALWLTMGLGLAVLILLITPPFGRSFLGIGEGMISGPGVGVIVDRILDDPDSFYGREVRVLAELDQVIDRHAFTVEDSDRFFDGDLLVVSSIVPALVPGWPAEADLSPKVPVTVVGTVRRFDRAAVEHELGIVLDGRRFVGREGRPVIVARVVAVVPGQASVRAPADRAPAGRP